MPRHPLVFLTLLNHKVCRCDNLEIRANLLLSQTNELWLLNNILAVFDQRVIWGNIQGRGKVIHPLKIGFPEIVNYLLPAVKSLFKMEHRGVFNAHAAIAP